MRGLRVATAVLVAALLVSAASASTAEADVEAEDWDAEEEVLTTVEMEVQASVGAEVMFPTSRRFDNLTANCMDTAHAICLGNATRTGARGQWAIGRDALPLGLVGHWTFDDAIGQDSTGHMDALYPAPKYGPGMNGGASAYFNGTAMHWLSPARSRAHPARTSEHDRKYRAFKRAKGKPYPPARGRRGSKKGKKKSKKLSKAARAAVQFGRSKAGGSVGPGGAGPAAGPGGAEDLTISFWVYLLSDVVGKFRTLIYRGDRDGATPHISLWPEIRRIHLRASTGVDPVTHAKTHITLDSHSAVLIGRWTHIAFVVQGTRLAQLYVNGVLDTQKLSLQPIRIHHNSDVMYLANNPFTANSGIRCYMDSVSIYSRALTRGQVTAIASVGFPGVDASSVKLGCGSCSLSMAAHACNPARGSHVCTQTELNSGALLVARTMGWISNLVSVHVYSAEEVAKQKSNPQAGAAEQTALLGAGLCCRNT